jgi:superfamily II DNA or RNA helicase
MQPSRKELRPYQVRLVTDVCRADADVLVEQPTGSGKTLAIVTLVAMHLGRRFTHAVIAAPQEQIEQGFVHRDYETVAFPECAGVAAPAFGAPEELIWGARQSELGSVRRLLAYLRQPAPDHALACTHAALNRLTDGALPADLSGKALFLDEAHHASADGLAQIVSTWRERCGQLLFFTATPYRGDGRPVALEGMRLFRRSLAEHMAEGFAPRHLDSEIVALGRSGDAITAGQFTGEEAPPPSYFDSLVTAICRKWAEDGKPKAIVRVPPMRGGSEGLVNRLLGALAAEGARTLDATGTTADDKQRFLRALAAEKHRAHAASRYDAMVGIQRVLEGTDWPVCSAVYCVGMPGSLNTVVQLLGRAMRPKEADYPAEHRDRARLVFFVPCGGGAALADLSLDHSRHALLTCCFLADHEVGQEWLVLREVRRAIEEALGRRDENPTAADAENEADEALDPEVRAEVEIAMAGAREQIVNDGGDPTLSEVVTLAAQARPDLPEVAFHRVAAEVLASQSGSAGEAAREAIHREVARRLRIEPMVKKAMEEAFAVVLSEFRAATLEGSTVLERVGRQVHGVTGGQMRAFAQRLRDAAPKPLTEEQIVAWADAHQERTGEWPTVWSGPVHGEPGETWIAINGALNRGLRSLPGGSSLAQLLAEHRGRRNRKGQPPLKEEQILAWADAHHEQTGKWPQKDSGAVADMGSETWCGINAFLIRGGRSLPGGCSLAKLLEERRGVRNKQNLPSLSVAQILAWADAHYQQRGKWPTPEAGLIVDAPGETWKGVQMALLQGRRGLPGGSSLAKVLEEHRNVRNQGALPLLTINQILAWADAHYDRTGKWPNADSGPISEAFGESWSAIQVALSRGVRGLPGGSSLARLLAEHRGRRNRKDQPPLTEEQILAWADAHHQRTGTWPTAESGAIPEAPGEVWSAILGALRQGSRSLPGGSSIARLLASRRGVKNIANPPALTVNQILVWADAHYERRSDWPAVNAGPVHDASDETWVGIDACLRNGSRGLPMNSSLATILAEHRGVRNKNKPPPLLIDQILAWADAHHQRTGQWPTQTAGPVYESPGEIWGAIGAALYTGLRGLPGGSSLAQLLAERRGVRNSKKVPQLTIEVILGWADAHYKRTGGWPKRESGPVGVVVDENWKRVDNALRIGLRGLPGGSSLVQLIKGHRGDSPS